MEINGKSMSANVTNWDLWEYDKLGFVLVLKLKFVGVLAYVAIMIFVALANYRPCFPYQDFQPSVDNLNP